MGLEYMFTYIYYICMANGSKYPIHGAYGNHQFEFFDDITITTYLASKT